MSQDRPQLRWFDPAAVTQVDLVVLAGELQPGIRNELVVHRCEDLGFSVIGPDVEGLDTPTFMQRL